MTYYYKTYDVPENSFLDSAFYFALLLGVTQSCLAIAAHRNALRLCLASLWDFSSARCTELFEWLRSKGATSKSRQRASSTARGSLSSAPGSGGRGALSSAPGSGGGRGSLRGVLSSPPGSGGAQRYGAV